MTFVSVGSAKLRADADEALKIYKELSGLNNLEAAFIGRGEQQDGWFNLGWRTSAGDDNTQTKRTTCNDGNTQDGTCESKL